MTDETPPSPALAAIFSAGSGDGRRAREADELRAGCEPHWTGALGMTGNIDWPLHFQAMEEAALDLALAQDLLASQIAQPDLPTANKLALAEALEYIGNAMAALPGGRTDA